jgi:hypothetical protein
MVTYRGEQVSIVPLETPEAPTLARVGVAGETTYSYQVVAIQGDGHSAASEEATIETGPATLTSSRRIAITPPYVRGARYYDIYRTAGGDSQGKIGTVAAINQGTTQTSVFQDRGQAGDDEDPPEDNTTGLLALPGLDTDRVLMVDADGNLTSPYAKQAHIADATEEDVHTKFNTLLDKLEALGLLAAS